MLAQFGKYTLLQKIGDGGMAEVFLAQIQGPGGFTKFVALKRMLPHLSRDQAFTRSFINEARLGGCLNHHNIVQTVEFGQLDDFYYLAMEYVRGVTLEDVLRAQQARKEPLPLPLALRIGVQIADGLAYAHSAEDSDGRPLKMVHRDLKPSNILINNHGGCKISDFGVARSEASTQQTVFGGEIKGTVSYMSPEQAMGERSLDARSDIFSLGVILYEMLMNASLYPQDSYLGTLRAAQDAEFAGKLEAVLALPQGERLHAILSRALARLPDERYATAHDLSCDLNDVLMTFEPEWELADYLKALLPKSALNSRGTMLGVPVMPPSGMTSGAALAAAATQTSQPGNPSVTSQPGAPAAAAAGDNSGWRTRSQPGLGAGGMAASGMAASGMAASGGAGGFAGGGMQEISGNSSQFVQANLGAGTVPVRSVSGQEHSMPGYGGNPGYGGSPGARTTHPQSRESNSGWSTVPAQGEISQTMNVKGRAKAPAEKPRTALFAGVGGAILVVAAVLAFVFSGGGKVEVISEPPGAQVVGWNGALLGTAPLTVEIPEGGMPIEARLEGYSVLRTTLQSGQRRVRLQLERARAGLTISVIPPTAQVTINGEPLSGSSPFKKEGLAPGRHTVGAQLAGYLSVSQSVELQAGAALNVDLVLAPESSATANAVVPPGDSAAASAPKPVAAPAAVRSPPPSEAGTRPGRTGAPVAVARAPKEKAPAVEPGFFTVNSSPYAKVEIDGQTIKTTPLQNHPLAPGAHSVRLTTEDGREKSFQIEIVTGQTVKKGIRFEAE